MKDTPDHSPKKSAKENTLIPLDLQPYDKKKLSYASTFENSFQRLAIQTMELLTARVRILRRIRRFEAQGVPFGQPFGNRH